MSQPIPTPSPSGSQQGSKLLSELEAEAGIAGGQPQGSAPVVASEPTPQEIEVDDGGATRRVSVNDLKETWKQRRALEQQQQAVNDGLAQLSQNRAVKELGDMIASLPPERRAMVAEILQGRMPQPQRTVEDQIHDDAFGEDRPAPAAAGDHQLREQLARLSNVVQHLAASEHRRLEQSHQQTMGERIDEQMSKYPVFAKEPGARLFARDFILKSVGPNGADLETIVQQAASRLQKHAEPAPAPVPSEGGIDAAITLPRGVAPTAKTLKSGDVRRAALSFLQGR